MAGLYKEVNLGLTYVTMLLRWGISEVDLGYVFTAKKKTVTLCSNDGSSTCVPQWVLYCRCVCVLHC